VDQLSIDLSNHHQSIIKTANGNAANKPSRAKPSSERIQNPHPQSFKMVGVPRYQREIVGQGDGSDLLIYRIFRIGNT
jgi:hypothetical protein